MGETTGIQWLWWGRPWKFDRNDFGEHVDWNIGPVGIRVWRVKEYKCSACGRVFLAAPRDVELAGGHLCMWADEGKSQREAIQELRRESGEND
jgi:hypothetical protein